MIREENILSLKIRTNEIDLNDADVSTALLAKYRLFFSHEFSDSGAESLNNVCHFIQEATSSKIALKSN